FGYYFNENKSTFNPLFKSEGMNDPSYADTPEKPVGSMVPFSINASVKNSFGFAIYTKKPADGSLLFYAEKNSLNIGTYDQVLTLDYAPETIYAFEDKQLNRSSDKDYDDIIISIEFDLAGSTCSYCGDGLKNQPIEECEPAGQTIDVCEAGYDCFCSSECIEIKSPKTADVWNIEITTIKSEYFLKNPDSTNGTMDATVKITNNLAIPEIQIPENLVLKIIDRSNTVVRTIPYPGTPISLGSKETTTWTEDAIDISELPKGTYKIVASVAASPIESGQHLRNNSDEKYFSLGERAVTATPELPLVFVLLIAITVLFIVRK
ncbi:MAG: DUF4114 domain-containing protein, partial [archaeon]|nr:DUF4114 domain-containing protein [archaeon]